VIEKLAKWRRKAEEVQEKQKVEPEALRKIHEAKLKTMEIQG
jgi:hypothetical protein